jgi:peptidoglycan-associated lipoprotein
MKQRYVLASLCVLLALIAGCRTPESGSDPDSQFEVLPDDVALGERFEDGVRVPAGEFNPTPVRFAYDSFKVARSEHAKMLSVAEFMRRRRDVKLVVEGHCDERGSRDYNLSLGEHRALALRAYLVGEGVAAKRIQTRSYGEEQPREGGHNERAWRLNRRGEFALFR